MTFTTIFSGAPLRRFLAGSILALFLVAGASAAASDFGVIIVKKDITTTAKFYPYTAMGVYMELFAVRASDGTIRTALNTCQVCYDSGRGFYKQEGKVVVCQNCGNRFALDQIEKIKGGCNPVPILAGSKSDLGDSIGIPKDFLAKMAPYFASWKR